MGQPVIQQGAWRFYTDATPDGSMVALAGENTAPTLTQSQIENGIIRLRVQLCETGGSKGDEAGVELQWSPDNSNWSDFGTPSTPDGAKWFFWANGAATGGNTIGSQLLTGTATSGAYHEQADDTEAIGISDTVEIDCALRIQWPPPNITLYLRVVYGGSAVSLKSGAVAITLTSATVANRSYTIDKSAATGGDVSLRAAMNPKAFWDGSYWWVFWVDDGNLDRLCYYYWSGSGNWSSQTYTTFGDTIGGSYNVALWGEVLGSTPVVMVIWNAGGQNATYKRGTISGTTISWGSETSIGTTGTDDDTSVGIDDGGYWWIAETINGTGVRARRSTNADSGSSWSAGWNSTHSASDSGITGGDLIRVVGLASNKALVVWGSGTAIKWALVDDTSGFGSVSTLVSVANTTDWGLARAGGYVYLVHTDSSGSSGNWVLKVFTESSESWATGTSPSVSGQGTSDDGLAVVASGSDDIYAIGSFTYDSYNNRKLSFKKYAGPGASGTWDSSLTDLTPDEARGNGDFLSCSPAIANGQLLIIWSFNDCDVGNTYPMTFEYHVLDVGGGEVTFTAAVGAATSTPSAALPVTRGMIATLTGGSTTPAAVLALAVNMIAAAGVSTTTPAAALAIIKSFLAQASGDTTTPAADLAVLRGLAAAVEAVTSTPGAVLSGTWSLAATSAASTTTPAAALALVVGMISEALASTTTPAAALSRLLTMIGQAEGATTTPAADLTLAKILSAQVLAQTTTPDAAAAVLRSMIAEAAAVTTTPAAVLGLILSMIAAAQAGTSTPAVGLDRVRPFTGQVSAATTTPDAVISLAKILIATVQAATTTPGASLALVVGMISAALAASTTPAASLAVSRGMVAQLLAQTTTPDTATISISGLVEFAGAALAATSTPNAALALTVSLVGAALAGTVTPAAILGLTRLLQAAALAQTTTPDTATLSTAALVEFTAQALAQSTTPSTALLTAIRAMAAQAQAGTATPAALLAVLRELQGTSQALTTTPAAVLSGQWSLTAAIAAGTATPDAGLGIIRGLAAQALAQTTTPSAELLLVLALGLVIATITASAPGASVSGRKPDLAGTGRKPGLTVTGEGG